MGFSKEHIQATAEELAMSKYHSDFSYLSPTIQEKLITEAGEIVDNELKQLAEFWRTNKQEAN